MLFTFLDRRSNVISILFLLFAVATSVHGFLFAQKVYALETFTNDFNVVSGTDNSDGLNTSFTQTDIDKLKVSDDTRIGSNASSWTQGVSYNEDNYLEFIFTPNIPNDAIVDKVNLTNEFRRYGALTGVKIEVWDGTNFVNFDLTKGVTGEDHTDILDLSSTLNTAEKVNNIKARFLAYRDVGANLTTSHDFISLNVTYHLPEVIVPPVKFTEINSDISVNTTWNKADGPYVIKKPIKVLAGATLSMTEGTIVKFDTAGSLTVDGLLDVEGFDTDQVHFTSLLDDSLGGDTNGDGALSAPSRETYAGIWPYVTIQSKTGNNILNNLVSKYSSGGFAIYDTNIISSGLEVDQQIFLSNSFGTFDKIKTFGFSLDKKSTASVSNSNLDSTNSYAVSLSNESFLDIINSTLHSGNKYPNTVAFVSTGSSLDLNNVNIYSDAVEVDGVSATDKGTSVTLNNTKVSGMNYAVRSGNGAKIIIKNTKIECLVNCVSSFNGDISIMNSKISGGSEEGIFTYGSILDTSGGGDLPAPINTINDDYLVEINNSEIFNNKIGISGNGVKVTGSNNSIHDNQTGAFNKFEDYLLDLKNNYWGDKTGPKNLLSNLLGIGNEVLDGITFKPFLTKDPFNNVVGLSNIMFIPGFQASRLYKNGNRIWEPGNALGGVSSMYMDENGESVDKDIYTKDIVDEAKIFGLNTINFYKSFMTQLDGMVSRDEIKEWKPIAYDWRFSPLDIVNRGTEKDGNISYTKELNENEIPYIINELQNLVGSSKSGKVTIVTHSNGGLVAKALIAKLVEMKNSGKSNLIDNIDNLITVAPPSIGTPKASFGLLHGYDQGMFNNILLGRKLARDFGQNLPGAYGLMPSEKYIANINDSKIFFDESLNKLNDWKTKYGESIDSYDEFSNFLVNQDNLRSQSSYDDLVSPKILNNKVLEKIKLLHNTTDNLLIPDNIKVYQLAGWGLPTAYSLHYQSKNKCLLFFNLLCSKKNSVLSSDIGITSGGDGTVVVESALFGNGEEYYLNLNKYNKFNPNKDHSDIFEVSYIYDFINNILKSDVNLPDYITKDIPAPVNYTIIKMRSPVDIDIYDKDNLHTGVTEDSNIDIQNIEESIPNSLYLEIMDDKYIIVPTDGDYMLKLKGTADGIFTLEQQQIVNNMPSSSVVWRDIPVSSIFNGEVDIKNGLLATNIKMDQNGDGIFETNLAPVDLLLEEKKDDNKNENRSSGSFIPDFLFESDHKNDQIEKEEFKDNIKTKKIVKENIVKSTKKSIQEKELKIDTTKTDTKNDDIESNNTKNNLGASSLSSGVNLLEKNKKPLLIIGIIVLIWLGIKFIFKLI